MRRIRIPFAGGRSVKVQYSATMLGAVEHEAQRVGESREEFIRAAAFARLEYITGRATTTLAAIERAAAAGGESAAEFIRAASFARAVQTFHSLDPRGTQLREMYRTARVRDPLARGGKPEH